MRINLLSESKNCGLIIRYVHASPPELRFLPDLSLSSPTSPTHDPWKMRSATVKSVVVVQDALRFNSMYCPFGKEVHGAPDPVSARPF